MAVIVDKEISKNYGIFLRENEKKIDGKTLEQKTKIGRYKGKNGILSFFSKF